MFKFKIGDLVVIYPDARFYDKKEYVPLSRGKLGIITKIYKYEKFPYRISFIDEKLNTYSSVPNIFNVKELRLATEKEREKAFVELL